MRSQRSYEYFVIKYVPNVANGDDANIGVLLLEKPPEAKTAQESSRLFAGVRFLKDWTVLHRLSDDAGLEVVLAIVEEINSRIESASSGHTAALFELLQELSSASNGVVLGTPGSLVADDPEKALDELVATHIPDASDPPADQAKRPVPSELSD